MEILFSSIAMYKVENAEMQSLYISCDPFVCISVHHFLGEIMVVAYLQEPLHEISW